MSIAGIGAEYDPIGAHLPDPHPFYARARAEAPVFYSEAEGGWVVTRFADLLAVLRRPDLYSSVASIPRVLPVRPAARAVLQQGYPRTPTVTESDEPLHRTLRMPFERMLSFERVQRLTGPVRERAEQLLAGFQADGQVELMSRYANVLPVWVVARLCGLDEADERQLRPLCQATIEMSNVELDEAGQVAAATGALELQRMAGRLVRDRHRRLSETPAGTNADVITEIVRAAVGDGELDFMTEAAAVNATMQVFIAGHITTTRTIGNAIVALLTEPAQWKELRARPELIPTAVEELLRYSSAVTGQWRDTTTAVTLGGVDLPAGSRILLRFDAANRDPDAFDRAEELDLTRSPRHLAFGFGIHYCVGAALARLQLGITLELLTRELAGPRLAGPVRYEPIFDLRGPVELHLAWDPPSR